MRATKQRPRAVRPEVVRPEIVRPEVVQPRPVHTDQYVVPFLLICWMFVILFRVFWAFFLDTEFAQACQLMILSEFFALETLIVSQVLPTEQRLQLQEEAPTGTLHANTITDVVLKFVLGSLCSLIPLMTVQVSSHMSEVTVDSFPSWWFLTWSVISTALIAYFLAKNRPLLPGSKILVLKTLAYAFGRLLLYAVQYIGMIRQFRVPPVMTFFAVMGASLFEGYGFVVQESHPDFEYILAQNHGLWAW